jgi:type IV secretory pathway VirB10-like protein
MSDQPSPPFSPPPVKDRRVTPLGVLPKNLQAWVLSGVAAAMVIVIALSGKTPPKAVSTPTQATAVVDPNSARIQDYERRIEEQARRLQLEQAQLTRTQKALTPSASSSLMSAFPAGEGALAPTARQSSFDSASSGQDPVRSRLQLERDKRESQAPFASNIVLSNRQDTSGATRQASARATSARAATTTGPAAAPGPPDPQNGKTPEEGRQTGETDRASLSRTDGKQFRLFEGTLLETVLTNRLDGYFSGPVNCMVTTTLYSRDGRHVLIPQGSRVLGEARHVETFGQQRLAVFFHRLIMPDGFSLTLDKFQGLNQVGDTGLSDQVNHHYLQIFGVSLAIGAIAGLGGVSARSGPDTSSLDNYQQSVAGSLSQSSLRIFDRYLNVLPTVTIREGHRVKIYLSGDLLLPAYDRHLLPNDL